MKHKVKVLTNMEKLPTIEEYLLNCGSIKTDNYNFDDVSIEEIRQIIKLHVQQALKTALDEIPYGGSDEIRYEDVSHILDCYPLDLIK